MAQHSIIIEIRVLAQQVASGIRSAASAINAGLGNSGAGGQVSAFTKKVGGMSAAIRASSGVLRAMGTAGFLVGGQFRTLGFALSAASSLIQNFGPLIFNVVGALGAAGKAMTAALVVLGGAFIPTLIGGIVQLGLFAVALSEVIQVGFEFNSQYERAVVSIGALVDQLFTLKDATGRVLEGQEALTAGFKIADEQLQQLRIDALETEFTFQELFTALQAGVAASSGTKGSLKDIRETVAGLARLASVAGIPASQLTATITQATQGTLRAVNRIKAPLAAVLDVPIKDLNAYTRQLREAGTLYDVLNKKLAIINLAGSFQAKTFLGIINNLKDAVQIFSADATKGAFDKIKAGMSSLLNTIFDFTTKDFTEPFKGLIALIGDINNRLAGDLVRVVTSLLSKVPEFVNGLAGSKAQIMLIYDQLMLVIKETGSLLLNIVSIFVNTDSIHGNLESISSALKLIAYTIAIVNDLLTAAKIIVNSFALLGTTMAAIIIGLADAAAHLVKILTFGFVDFTRETGEWSDQVRQNFNELGSTLRRELEADTAFSEISKKFEELNDKIRQTTRNAVIGLGEIFDAALKKGEEQKQLDLERKRFDEAESKAARERVVSELQARISYNSAVRNQRIQIAQDQLKFLQESLKSEETAHKNQLDDQLISVESYYKRVNELHRQDFESQIREQELLRVAAREKARDDLKALEEDNKLKRQAAAQEADREPPTGVSPEAQQAAVNRRLQSQILQNQIKANTVNVNLKTEEAKIDANLREIEQKRLQDARALTRERILQQQAVTEELRLFRELFTEIVNDDTSLMYVQERMRAFIEQNKTAIAELQRRIREGQADLKTSSGAPMLRGVSPARDAQRDLDTILKSQSLRVLNETILNKLGIERSKISEREEQIKQNISLGVIDQSEGERQLNALSLERAKILSKTADQLEAVLAEMQKVIDLPREFVDKTRVTIDALRREAQEASSITESVLLKASDNLRDSFRTLFEDLQEDIGNAKNAFASFALSIIKSVQKMLADRFVQQLFGKGGIFDKLLSPQGQTTGRATGIWAKILRTVGFDPNSKDAAGAKTPDKVKDPLGDQVTIIFDQFKRALEEIFTKKIQVSLADQIGKIESASSQTIGQAVRIGKSGPEVIGSKTLPDFVEGLPALRKAGLGAGMRTGETLVLRTDDGLARITYTIQSDGTLLRKITSTSSGKEIKVDGENVLFPDIFENKPAIAPTTGTTDVTEIGTASAKAAGLEAAIQQEAAAMASISGSLTTLTGTVSGIAQSLTTITATLQTMINVPLSTLLSAIQSIKVGVGDGLFEEAAAGGYIRGPGTSTSDSISARLSDGEYVVRAKAVKALGVEFFDMVNSLGFANGGAVHFDAGGLAGIGAAGTAGAAAGVGKMSWLSKIFKGKYGGALASAGFTIGLALLSRLFAPKAPKTDPNRVKDPYGLNPNTLTFYKHPIIKGVRTYLANGGLVTGKNLYDEFGTRSFADGGLASAESLSNLGVNAVPATSPITIKQNVKIQTPDIRSFRNSKQTIERELGQMARRGLARHRGRY